MKRQTFLIYFQISAWLTDHIKLFLKYCQNSKQIKIEEISNVGYIEELLGLVTISSKYSQELWMPRNGQNLFESDEFSKSVLQSLDTGKNLTNLTELA